MEKKERISRYFPSNSGKFAELISLPTPTTAIFFNDLRRCVPILFPILHLEKPRVVIFSRQISGVFGQQNIDLVSH